MSIIELLPPMLSGDKLNEVLGVFPSYDETIRFKTATERLIALQDIYNLYVPSSMGREIYTKLYLSLIRSLQKKQTIIAIRQASENSRRIRQQGFESIIGGADSFTIIGSSGIGKTSAISRASSIILETPILEVEDTKILTCLNVQCPADTSVKGLLLEILRKADEILESRYYSEALRAKSTIDVLIGTVSQVALNHLGLIVIDEIQNVVTSKNGKTIIGTLTQLINNSGVSIVMVGTPSCEEFFTSEMVLARRSVGLSYSEMCYGEEYIGFIKILLKYNYTQTPVEMSEAIFMWLYSHTGGNRALTVQLVHDSQEIAIMSGSERLDIASLNQAFEQRMTLLHDYIKPDSKKYTPLKKNVKKFVEVDTNADLPQKIADVSLSAKRINVDVVSALKEYGIQVIEVSV